ncbi:inner membrane transport permease YbhR [bacterium BMS3Bbin03]|nr:inner membrane transport permease YbhR [bacterium BMS3Bbin03]
MRNYFAITNRELKSYFVSPIAYVVIALFVLITAIFFYLIISNFVQLSFRYTMQAQYYRMAPPKLNVNSMAIRPLLHNISLFALFWLPLLTMRLFAEEKKSGTIELLFTSPVKTIQMVLAKFTASSILFAVMLVLTFFYIISLFFFGNPELGPILSGYLGLLLIGMSYIAFGLFFSSITDNQIIAAVATFAFILFFWAIGWMSGFVSPGAGAFLEKLSLINHFDDFAKGVIDSGNVIYYLSFTFFGIFLTYISLESKKWRL